MNSDANDERARQSCMIVLDELLNKRPELKPCSEGLIQIHDRLVTLYKGGGKLLLCGNGGSCADAQHIAGELCKSFEAKRNIPHVDVASFEGLPYGAELASNLEVGFAAIPLGLNPALKSAIENDSPMRDIAIAQECYALIKPDDVLLVLSTSGNSSNCIMAMSVAKAAGADTIVFTGSKGGEMGDIADYCVNAPGKNTREIQENHIALYHCMCLMLEKHFFPDTDTD